VKKRAQMEDWRAAELSKEQKNERRIGVSLEKA
jgi:hypothetical protein